MAVKKNLMDQLNKKQNDEDLQTFEEATDRVIKKPKESRTQQFVALLPPSVHRDLMDASEGMGKSGNQIINDLLETFIEEHQKEIERGRKIRKLKEEIKED